MKRLAALLAIGGLLYGPVAQAHVTARRPTPALARMNVERNRANPTRIKMELAFRNFRAQELARPHVIPVQALMPPLARHPRKETLDAIPPMTGWGPDQYCAAISTFGLYLSVIAYVLGGAGVAEHAVLNVGMAKVFFWTGIGLGATNFVGIC